MRQFNTIIIAKPRARLNANTRARNAHIDQLFSSICRRTLARTLDRLQFSVTLFWFFAPYAWRMCVYTASFFCPLSSYNMMTEPAMASKALNLFSCVAQKRLRTARTCHVKIIANAHVGLKGGIRIKRNVEPSTH